jgi:hypothetical protein
MQKRLWILLVLTTFCGIASPAQTKKINRNDFFSNENPIEITLSTNIKSLRTASKNPSFQPAAITFRFPDSSMIHEQILVRRRGQYRNQNCYLASLSLNFKTPGSPLLSPLKKLKWVSGCNKSSDGETFLLKEYLVYKIYNLITPMSFRVRLLKATYRDTTGKVKPYSQYAFLIEDIDDLAKRNKCVEKKGIPFPTEMINRSQMTMVAMFEYMIGNTDWAIPAYHNIKLMVPKKDTLSKPYAIPYDFDYCGFVNPPYAVPPEHLGIHAVTERLYRGFPRNIEEQEAAAAVFNREEPQIIALVNQFDLLGKREKMEILDFLDAFFKVIKNKDEIKAELIDKARTN